MNSFVRDLLAYLNISIKRQSNAKDNQPAEINYFE